MRAHPSLPTSIDLAKGFRVDSGMIARNPRRLQKAARMICFRGSFPITPVSKNPASILIQSSAHIVEQFALKTLEPKGRNFHLTRIAASAHQAELGRFLVLTRP
jgi:hypothetical protein